jgi:O-antigen ligase
MTVDRVAGVALMVIGLVTIWESRVFPLGSLHRPGPAYMPVVLAALLILFAAWGLERLGYRLTMALVVIFLLMIVERKGWALGLVLTVAMAWGSFFLFDTLLRVPLPRGPFGL